jgi:glycosyltransferase involved in cell wall biosynthesis
MTRISVIVPAYNEGRQIYENIQEFLRVFTDLQYDIELIVVDDGSTDNTYEEALRVASDRIRVLTYPENRGKGYALRQGVREATGELVTFIDADLDLHPCQTEVLLQKMGERVDAVVGSKRHPGSRVIYPWKRRFLSACYHWMTRFLFGLKLKDTQAGIKLFRREALLSALPHVKVNGYAFDLDLLVNVHDLGYRISEAPIVLEYRFNGSGINATTIWQIFKDTMRVFFRERLRRRSNGRNRADRLSVNEPIADL